MLIGRGLARSPASALRYSFSRQTKLSATRSTTRQFSQAQTQIQTPSQSSVSLSRRLLSHPATSRYGPMTRGTSGVMASSVFAQRSGAARNLSLWPFGSKPQTTPATEAPATVSAGSPAATATEPPVWQAESPSPSAAPAHAPESQSDFSQIDLGQLNDLISFDPQGFLNVTEHIGYFKELGLDYGLGFTSSCLWMLEHIHVYTGLPWWGTIAAASLIFRAAIFYPSLVGSKHQALTQQVVASPAFKEAKARFDDAAFRTGDRAVMTFARNDMNRLKRQAGASTWRTFIGFAMFPFSFGMFRGIQAMTGIPVPGMEQGGLLWFPDLTVPDPLYLLPAISVGAGMLMFRSIKRSSPTMEPGQQAIMNGMMYVMPPLMFVGTAWLPAAIQWFFLNVSLSSIIQTQAIIHPAVRQWMGMPPLPNSATPNPGSLYQSPTSRNGGGGLRAQLQEGLSAAQKKMQEATGHTDEKERWTRAQTYEERRAEEEKQKAEQRLEEIRRRRNPR